MTNLDYRELYRCRRELLFKKDYARSPAYAKQITHRITPFFVYSFVKVGITPNQTTFLSLGTGLVAASLFLIPLPWAVLGAAFFLELYYVLDSVDGQLARFTRQFSRTGAFFDVLGNYIIHPLIFLSIGIGQYFVTREGLVIVWGAVAALSYLWLGLMWDVRSSVLLEALNKERAMPCGESLETPKSLAPSLVQRVFSWTHKICTYPRVMNVVTFVSVAEVISGNLSLYSHMLLAYAVMIPFVSLSKVFRMVATREIDRAYEWLVRKS